MYHSYCDYDKCSQKQPWAHYIPLQETRVVWKRSIQFSIFWTGLNWHFLLPFLLFSGKAQVSVSIWCLPKMCHMFGSLLYQPWVQKMDSGSPQNHSCLYANLVVMVLYGNWLMTEASLNGSTNMEGKAPLLDKSGYLLLVCSGSCLFLLLVKSQTIICSYFSAVMSLLPQIWHSWHCQGLGYVMRRYVYLLSTILSRDL